MASSKETYCLCGQPYNIGQFMIECDVCREWFHGSCVDVKIFQSDDIDKYHCPKCAATYGPSVLKMPTNNHRADRYELGAESRPSQVGTPAWVQALAARPLRPSPHATQRMRPQQFTEEFVRDNGFTKPVIFTTTDGLDMKIPNPDTFTVRSVLRYCGASLEVEVIDVRKQATVRMTLGEFVEYIETPIELREDRVLNVLSLEFSETNMRALVQAPGALRALDWAERAWPAGERARPAVQRYCLVSAAAAYTDFHVDFGGTTVWYHVLHGQKIFYLIPPTSTNLALYQQWCASNNQNERFFGDMVEWYGTAELTAGQTLFIPSGWIHAVLTPCDSLVFGGNLLHSYAIEMQLQIYEIERRVETPTMFRYPLFEAMHWYAGAHLLIMLRRHNEETQDEDFIISESCVQSTPAQLPPLLLRGIKILANALKEWHALKSTDSSKRDNVPKCLNSGQLVRELCKELRTLEKRSSSTANKDKDYKVRNNASPTKQSKKQQSSAKKSLKLTLPKPIMHMTPNGEFAEEKVFADKFYVDNKEVIYQERYVQSVDYANGLPDAKYIVDGKEVVLPEKYTYQTYEEVPYSDGNGYVEKIDKKSVLKIKMSNSPSSSREEAPPPYPLPEHSILKSHLIRADPPTLKPIHQWTISKKDIGEYQEEQILFTNENLQTNVRMEGQDLNYGPGMYSAEDVQPDYQYSEAAKPGSYQPEYGYRPQQQITTYTVNNYQRYVDVPAATVHQQEESYTNVPVQEPVNGAYHPNPLPSYDAAIAQQYATNNYPPSTAAAASPGGGGRGGRGGRGGECGGGRGGGPGGGALPVRRSERPVRRRVSTTYDYEDCDLYIDDAPAPRRRKPPKHRAPHARPHASSNTNTTSANTTYRQPPNRPAPTNGIESLIQASVLAEEEQTVDAPEVSACTGSEDADAAVAGMLSISERFNAPRTFGLAHAARAPPPPAPAPARARSPGARASPAQPRHSTSTPSSSKRSRKPPAAVSSADEDFVDEQDVIKEVHRDEEYVYPSLDMSSDEDDDWSLSRRRRNTRKIDKSKSEKDESWSPRARLGRLVPRLRGPARGVRRECVRAALCAAANRHRAHAHAHPHAPHAAHAPHAPHAAHPPHPPHPTAQQNAKRAVLATKSRRPPPPVHNTPNNKNIRLKKGMKTAKQRLGKILKIHKMIY